MQGGRVDSSGDCLVDGAVRGLKAIGAQFVSLNGSALMTDVATAEWRMSECRFALNAGTDPVLEVLDNELVSLVGCDVVGNGNDAGLAIDGNVPLIEVVNCRIDNVTNGIEYVAGTVNRAKVIGSDFNAFTGTAIEWPTASIPGSGLLVAACSGGAGTFLGGHSQFDARVNYKGNAANGALIQETPIVGPPTSISVTETGTQQDWVPDGDAEAFDRCTTLFVQTGGGGNLVIGGLAPPLRSTSRHRMQIVKVSAADDVILNDDDAGSAAAARIKVCVFRAIKLIDTSFVIEYATSAWRVVAAIGQELP